MRLYWLLTRLANKNLRPICAHIASDEREARRIGERCGCVGAEDVVVVIEHGALREVGPRDQGSTVPWSSVP